MSEEKKSFIVTLKENASPTAFKEALSKLGGEITHEYNLIKGFAVKLPATLHIDSLKSHTDVATVEEDKEVTTQGDTQGTLSNTINPVVPNKFA